MGRRIAQEIKLAFFAWQAWVLGCKWSRGVKKSGVDFMGLMQAWNCFLRFYMIEFMF